MNVSMADAFNLGWKLAAVVRGEAGPALLDTYTAERHAKAVELIEFDKDMARLFSEKPKSSRGSRAVPELLPEARPVHRWRRDPLRPVDDRRDR